MTIETKYNIGDEVWIHTLGVGEKGKYKKVKVIGVTINVRASNDVIIEYALTRNGYYYCRRENTVFPTKEELLKSL